MKTKTKKISLQKQVQLFVSFQGKLEKFCTENWKIIWAQKRRFHDNSKKKKSCTKYVDYFINYEHNKFFHCET